MTRFPATVAVVLLLSASPSTLVSQETTPAPPIVSSSTLVATDEIIGSKYGRMALEKAASSDEYGYSSTAPVAVGGGFSNGSKNTYRFLNSLLGPAGQAAHYRRVGTCCEFKTPNSPFGDSALLEVYEVTYDGAEKPLRLYFNWYDPGDVFIPMGLSASK